MKNLFSKTSWGLLLAVLIAGSASAQTRLAIVDLSKVFDNYWKTKQAQGVLKERQADMEKEFKNMLEDRKKSKETYDKLIADANDPAVSADEKEKRKKGAEDQFKRIREQEETIQQYERQARATLDEQTRRMRDNILTEIRTIINARAKAAGYTMVLDSASESINKTPVVLFTNNENDMTQEVLKELNATAPIDTAKPEEKKSAAPGAEKKK